MRHLLKRRFFARLIIFILFILSCIVWVLFLMIVFFLKVPIFLFVLSLSFRFFTKALILIDALEHSVYLLLKKGFKFFNHEIIDWTSLDEIWDKTIYCVAFVHNNSLKSKVCHIDVNIKFGFTVVFDIDEIIFVLIIIWNCLLILIFCVPHSIFSSIFRSGRHSLLFLPLQFGLLIRLLFGRNFVVET